MSSMSYMEERKVQCRDCHWHGLLSACPQAENPFELGSEIVGCPKCNATESMESCCQWFGCWKLASCGTPSPDGYRSTCFEHRPPFKSESQPLEPRSEQP